ncbi:peptidoglycan-associated lipoprotein [Pseudomonas psychrotolerans]|uniref:Peptidoglycan-associated lipoprotein n=2 Tax=Pseudomonas oryzihabitans TaxID=47885 RepID=A0AAJ2BHT0_9PSED|nr:peptidoglycan-associated lipoprotein [Pseudomonas psychrotolerans]MDR6358035.1 peptidoglycan-associated lipoprotein [Pseudomonas psychrotolerans]
MKPMFGSCRRPSLNALLFTLLVLGGCASPPQTSVVLMPDEDGHVGAVSIANPGGRQTLDQGYAQVTVAQPGQAPTPPQVVSQTIFDQQHRQILAAQPSPPKTFTLNFLSDSMELTPQSKALLPEVLETARQRLPTEISVFGHADASGTPAYNLDLSAQRARKVAALLQRLDPHLVVNVDFFGDKVPLVPSRPGKSEPRNRRVEILIL